VGAGWRVSEFVLYFGGESPFQIFLSVPQVPDFFQQFFHVFSVQGTVDH
jgi:hypothetical protein